MDIHKPKPWHGSREFMKEIGTIVIGVLIALAAEQGVEAIHWSHKVDDAHVRLHRELRTWRPMPWSVTWSTVASTGDCRTEDDLLAGPGRSDFASPDAEPEPWPRRRFRAASAVGAVGLEGGESEGTATHLPQELE